MKIIRKWLNRLMCIEALEKAMANPESHKCNLAGLPDELEKLEARIELLEAGIIEAKEQSAQAMRKAKNACTRAENAMRKAKGLPE